MKTKFGSWTSNRSQSRWPRSNRLAVERLDERLLPTTFPVAAPWPAAAIPPSPATPMVSPFDDHIPAPVLPPNAAPMMVSINGLAYDDRVEIHLVNGQYRVSHWKAEFGGAAPPALGSRPIPALYQWNYTYYNPSTVNLFIFNGNGGDDVFVNHTGVATRAYGGSQTDEFFGGSGRDQFFGGDGYDSLEGGGGEDSLYGGAGDDYLKGGAGDDALDGGAGRDAYAFPASALGADTVVEAVSGDGDLLDFSQHAQGVTIDLALTSAQTVSPGLTLTFSTATGIENVGGSAYADTIKGNSRDNSLVGLGGDDFLYGRGGTNSLSDGQGNDTVDFSQNAVGVTYTTAGGHDTVIGSPFADVLTGSGGSDRLEGRGGDDQLSGGSGDDYLYGGTGSNTINDGPDNDTVDFSQNAVAVVFATAGGHDTVIGSAFADCITGSGGNDQLEGWGGDDQLCGGFGSDYLYGFDGNDRLSGGPGNDHLYGGNNNDWLFGEADKDTLYGGNDNDWLEAGSGSETADGGSGTDWNAHVWAVGGTTPTDVNQGSTGTCVVLSALAAATQQHSLTSRFSYLGNFTYGVYMYDPALGWLTVTVPFDGTMVQDAGMNVVDPAPAAEGESWVVLYQRAYLKHFYSMDPLNGAQVDGFGGESDGEQSIRSILGGSAETTTTFDAQTMRSQLLAGQTLNVGGTGHRYAVTAVFQDAGANWKVTLYNPWGNDGVHQATMDIDADGSSDGFITMTWAEFTDPNHFGNYTYSC